LQTLVDRYGRPLKNLRISVIDECNYRCVYCHFEGWPRSSANRLLTVEDYRAIAEVAVSLGVTEFKITGGEPLLRSDLTEIISAINDAGPSDISLTTNGFKLRDVASDLRRAGLRRIAVSVPSLRRERYSWITGVDKLGDVIEGLKAAKSAGFNELTINVVLLRDVNTDEIEDLVELASELEAKLRIIELEPINIPRHVFERFYISANYVREVLSKRIVTETRRELHNRPVLILDNGIKVELVQWWCNEDFCMHCTRVRLSADGVLKPCIMSREGVDLKPCLKPRHDKQCIESKFKAVNSTRFPYCHVVKRGSSSSGITSRGS